jgi:gliding motility-associated-like protein
MIVFLSTLFFSPLLAQPCATGVQNNTIELRPAVCANAAALLQGSSPTGGNGNYRYQWEVSHGNCGENDFEPIDGATGKDYIIPQNAVSTFCYRRIVISGNCKDKSNKLKVESENLVQPVPPTTAVTQPTCAEPLGKIIVTNPLPAIGITYSIDGVNYTNTTGIFAGLSPGIYHVTVKYSSGCISPENKDTIKAVATPPTGTVTPTAATLCEGSSVTLLVSGGRSYQWYRNGTAIQGATGAAYKASEAGTYTADIFTESCKGKAQNEAVVTRSTAPSGSITPSSATVCDGSSVTLSVTGGTSYQWYRDGAAINGATTATYKTSRPGIYTATILTAACQGKASNSAVIAVNPPITFTLSITNPDCTTASGSIEVRNASGGTGNFLYSSDAGASFQKENNFAGLSPGTYTVVVKDDAGCNTTKTATINASVSTLKATTSVTNITCSQSSGTVTVLAGGGKIPFQYSLDGKEFQAANVFTGLAAGDHKVTVKDATGCIFETSFIILKNSSTLTGTATVTDATCKEKGAVLINPSGGVPAYAFRLDDGAFQSSNTFSNLTIAAHKVTIKDMLGCMSEVQFEVKQIGNKPNLIITNPPPVCAGSTVNIKDPSLVKGSDNNLVYSYWKDAAATIAVTNPEAVTSGTYYIKAVNNDGCFTIKPVVVSVHSSTPGRVTVSGPNTVCTGQAITLTTNGGKSYQWFRNNTPIPGATDTMYKTTIDGVYSVVIDDGTCKTAAFNTVQLKFQSCVPTPTETNVFVPTAFTPNNNGTNDVLRPLLYNIASLQYFRVYNRWGQLVFQTNAIGKGWDGTINGVQQPTETYTWLLECTDNSGKLIKQSGRSLLIR